MRWENWHWAMFFTECFSFLMPVITPPVIHTHLTLGADAIGPFKAQSHPTPVLLLFLLCELHVQPIITPITNRIWTPALTCAKPRKKSCSGEYCVRPGNSSSSGNRSRNLWYARSASRRPPLSAMFSPCVLMPFTWNMRHIMSSVQTAAPQSEHPIRWLTVKLSPSCDTLYWLYCSTIHCTRCSYSRSVPSVHHCLRFPSLS